MRTILRSESMDNPCKYCDKTNMEYLRDCEYGCDNPCEKAKNFYKQVGNKLDELLKAAKKFDLHTTNIFLAHPLDLMARDMKQFPMDNIFISEIKAERGKILLVKDEELKKELYEFAYNNPDRVFWGEKDFKE